MAIEEARHTAALSMYLLLHALFVVQTEEHYPKEGLLA
jgi:hypothetical protein